MHLPKFKLVSSLIFITSTLLLSTAASAMPIAQDEASAFPAAFEWDSAGTEVDFTAIVSLSGCSGSLVRYETSLGNENAMVLTNAHCLSGGLLPPGVVKINEPVTRTFRLLSSDGRAVLGTLTANKILYATLTGTDLALYGLQETYDDIEKRYRVTALTLSSAHPVQGRRIAIPSGYWRRIYSCSIERFIPGMREAQWTWKDSIRYLQPGCETIGGTSGSPIVDSETRQVIGVNNTGNESGQECTMNNPCEVDADGRISYQQGASYGQQTYWVYSCLTALNRIDLTRPGCELPKPKVR